MNFPKIDLLRMIKTHGLPCRTVCGAALHRSSGLMSVPLSLDEEVRLYTTNAAREKYESLATLYGIIVALDYLERAYVRDSVTAAEYGRYSLRFRAHRLRDRNEEVFSRMHAAAISV